MENSYRQSDVGDIAIRVENLGKRYRIGERQRYKALRDTLTDGLRAPIRLATSLLNGRRFPVSTSRLNNHVWALKDVSFEVKQGEVVAIIGRNGAGKSTLLKILSRITRPTEGHARICGRLRSLLEVGTGFHPELTGRENLYLNGAILGMRKAEIDRKFDEIVAFADVEKFIDTPVKLYSSGMYVRLAFAVAAHLEPEILLVDEVLAVGDAAFQKKCLGKMDKVAKEGRTVLFVSHNMAAVQRLCKTGYLLEQGMISATGDVATVVDAYYKTMPRHDPVVEVRHLAAGTVRFLEWQVIQSSTGDSHSSYTREPCRIGLRLGVRRVIDRSSFGIALWSDDGQLVWAMRSLDNGGQYVSLRDGVYQIDFVIPELPLRPGQYQIQVSVNSLGDEQLDMWHAQPSLRILPKDETGIPLRWQGILNVTGEFDLRLLESCHNS